MKRFAVSLMLVVLSAPSAFAAEWIKDSVGNYSLVAKGQALTMECRVTQTSESTTKMPTLYYWPSCGIGCKDTNLDDVSKKATIIVDERTFTASVMAGDTEALPLKRADEAPELFEALAKAAFISVYSSQISPRYSAFEAIRNPQVLAEFYQECSTPKK
mgnify:CR=1 FL=1